MDNEKAINTLANQALDMNEVTVPKDVRRLMAKAAKQLKGSIE